MELTERLRALLADRYRIEREIGRGGNAVVFLARDLKHDRDVALKVLRPELTQSVGAERFHREVEITARFRHLHILPLFDSGIEEGLLYYVMPYVEEGSLRSLIHRSGALPIPDVVRITRQIADALAHAHARGVVHRDVKPENVMFVDGEAVLADFGIAHAYSEAGGDQLTSQGLAIGTPEYMSPEQASAERIIDGRSDVYSLGCVVYEMLSGGPPFTGPTTQAVLAKHRLEPPPPIEVVRPGIPQGMKRALERALAKVPADRYPAAGAFVEALASGIDSPPARRSRVAEWWSALRPASRVFVVGGLAVALGGTVPGVRALMRSDSRGFEGRPESVLVLPYQTDQASEEERELAAELAGAVTRQLNQWESIRAVPQVAVSGPMFDRGLQSPGIRRVDDGIAVARDLGVQALIVLTTRLEGDTARLEGALWDVAAGSGVGRPWNTAGPATEVDRLIAPIVYGVLGLPRTPGQVEDLHRYSAHPDAVAADLAGTDYLARWRLADAERLFRRAIALDSTFGMALHHLAQTLYWQTAQQTKRVVQTGPEIAHLTTNAVRHAGDLPTRDRLHVLAFHALQDGRFDEARSTYRLLLGADSTDVYAWLMLGSVEFNDRWLTRTNRGTLAPRGNLNVAERAFAEAVRLQPGFDLGYGHLGDIAETVASSAHGGGCPGFELPREELLLQWDTRSPQQMVAFCPVALDSIAWLEKDSFDLLDRSVVVQGAERLMERWERLLRRWAAWAPDEPKPLRELVDALLDRRARLSPSAPETLDSLTRTALGYALQALALERDTLPSDLLTLGALYLGIDSLDRALDLTDRAVAMYAGAAVPSFAANVYVAAGQAGRGLDLVSNSRRMTYIPGGTDDRLIPYGAGRRVVDRIRVLGATGVTGRPLAAELARLETIWSPPAYSDDEIRLLREHAILHVAIAVAQDTSLLAGWLGTAGVSDPVWRAVLAGARHAAAVRSVLDSAVRSGSPELSDASEAFLLGITAAWAREHDLAIQLFSRLDSLPLPLRDLDMGWGLRSLSFVLRATEYEALGKAGQAQQAYQTFLTRWRHADSTSAALHTRAAARLR